MGVHQTRDGIFNGSLYIALGVLLKCEKDRILEFFDNKKRLYIFLIISSILYIFEIYVLITYNIGERDVLLFGPLIAVALFVLGLKNSIPMERAIILRKMSTIIFVIHYFALNTFQKIFDNQYVIFMMAIIFCVGISYAIAKMDLRKNIKL